MAPVDTGDAVRRTHSSAAARRKKSDSKGNIGRVRVAPRLILPSARAKLISVSSLAGRRTVSFIRRAAYRMNRTIRAKASDE